MTDASFKSVFQAIENNLNQAYEMNDSGKLEELLSDDWTMLEPALGIINRENILKAIREGRLTHVAMQKQVLQVKCFDNVAIVISRGKNIGRYLEKPFNTEVWVTNVYMNNGSNWICISTQEAPVTFG